MKLEKLREAHVRCHVCNEPIPVGTYVTPINTASGFYRVHPQCKERVTLDRSKGKKK